MVYLCLLAQLWLGAAGGESLEEIGYIKAERHIFPLSFRALTTSQTHYFGLGRLHFWIVCRFFFLSWIQKGSKPKRKGRMEWKQSCGGLWKITLLRSWDNKQWPMMIITEQLQKHWEKGKHHSAAIESLSDWSYGSWTSAQMVGKSAGLEGAQTFCY